MIVITAKINALNKLYICVSSFSLVMNWLQVKSNSSVIHSNLVLNATTTSITLGEYSNDITITRPQTVFSIENM